MLSSREGLATAETAEHDDGVQRRAPAPARAACVRAVAAAMLAQRDLEVADAHRTKARSEQRLAVHTRGLGGFALQPDDRADRADDDQDLRQRPGVPGRPRALAERPGRGGGGVFCRGRGAGLGAAVDGSGRRLRERRLVAGVGHWARPARPRALADAPTLQPDARACLATLRHRLCRHGGRLAARHCRRSLAPMLAGWPCRPPPRHRPAGIPGSELAGPFAVGEYAAGAAREAARLRAGAAGRRAGEPAPVAARACTSSCATPAARCPARRGWSDWEGDAASAAAGRRRRACRWWWRAVATTTRAAPPPRPAFSLQRDRPARGGRGRPARADRAAAQAARRRGSARAPAAAARPLLPRRSGW